MEETRLDKMNGLMTKLQDVLNSQESLIEKISKIQVDLFELEDNDLEENVNNFGSQAKETHDLMQETIEDFEMAINRAKQEDE